MNGTSGVSNVKTGDWFNFGNSLCNSTQYFYCLGSQAGAFVNSDPHFVGFDGSRYDFQGEVQSVDAPLIYNLITDVYFNLHARLLVIPEAHQDGTYMDKLGFTCLSETEDKKRTELSFDRQGALIIDGVPILFDARHAFPGGVATYSTSPENITSLLLQPLDAVDASIIANSKQFAIVQINCQGYIVAAYVVGNHVDFSVVASPRGVINPHGVLGQTLKNLEANKENEAPRIGYGPNGEGVVEGVPSDYLVKDGFFGTEFHFNRFGLKSEKINLRRDVGALVARRDK